MRNTHNVYILEFTRDVMHRSQDHKSVFFVMFSDAKLHENRLKYGEALILMPD